MDKVLEYPEVEKKLNKNNLGRYYVINCPESFQQIYGFKSELALRKCWAWWYNNAYLKNISSKEASRAWESKGREDFYSTIKNTPPIETKSIGLKVKSKLMKINQEELPEVSNSIEVPDWMD